jgi:hypothetical protein
LTPQLDHEEDETEGTPHSTIYNNDQPATDTTTNFLTMMIVRKQVTTTSRICLATVLLVACTFSRFEHGDASWVDPDTPDVGLTTEPLTRGDDREYTLVSVAVGM